MWLAEVDSDLVLACVDHMAATQVLNIPSPRFELSVMVILLLNGALRDTRGVSGPLDSLL